MKDNIYKKTSLNINNEKIKLTANILFSGIGCQERGFINSGVFNIEVLTTSEINKESVLSYAAIHCGITNKMIDTYKDYPSREDMAQYLTDINLGYEPEKNKYFDWFKLVKKKKKDLEKYWLACKLTHNLGDITRIKDLPYADFWTISFPCQSISIAGKMKGLKPDSGTRSSLLWENIRLLKNAKENNKLPKYLMFENVKNLVSKKFINDFNNLLDILNEIGFNSYWSVLNGKDCGIPQSRERVFVISIRKDIDKEKYTFPQPFDIGIRLKDVLEDQVDEKYYLSDEKVQNFLKTIDLSQFCKNDNKLHQLGYINNYNGDSNRIYSDNIARTLKSEAGGGGAKTGWYITKNKNITGLISNQGTKFEKETEYANTLLARDYKGFENQAMNAVISGLFEMIRVRKLTPKECYRLMGFTFEDCNKAIELGVADTHLYKQAGNGIITNCCTLLAEHLYKAQYDNTYICTDEWYKENFNKPQIVESICGENKPILLGGIGEINFGKQYRQGNRVYDSNAIAMCLTAQPLGNTGGYSYLYSVKDNVLPAVLKYQRTEYAKKIRKDYEAGKIKERRCNMREYTLRDDGLCNTITTVTKDNYIAVGAAMRGRNNVDNKIVQQIEIRNEELSNAITTACKDSLVAEKYNFTWLEKKYIEFYEKYGYIPEYFVPYNGTECIDYAPTLTANSNTSPTHSGTVLITEIKEKDFDK